MPFPAIKNFENRLRFDEVNADYEVGSFCRLRVVFRAVCLFNCHTMTCEILDVESSFLL